MLFVVVVSKLHVMFVITSERFFLTAKYEYFFSLGRDINNERGYRPITSPNKFRSNNTSLSNHTADCVDKTNEHS